MITIRLSDKAYENDVYPLVKAFYPDETVKVCREELESGALSEKQSEKSVEENKGSLCETDFATSLEIEILFLEQKIEIIFTFEGLKESHQRSISMGNSIADYKNTMKRFLYDVLSELTEKKLPWGILTGIRPTKLVLEMLCRDMSEEAIHRKMREEYLCSDVKTDLSIRIAKREIDLLEEMDYKNGYSLYIGIPFCPSTCLYCSFTSYSVAKFSDLVEDYLAALEKEIRFGAKCFPNKKLTTVYFGGGTPTTLTAAQLDRLLGLVKECFDFTYVKEFCVEAGRPDSITMEKLEVLKKWGVDRISINPQSMQQKTLDIIGRKHTVEDIVEAFCMARETGHNNINMDIIIGLPGENPGDVKDTLRRIAQLNPESLTVHTLALKRAARLNLEKKNYEMIKAVGVPEMLLETMQFAERNNYLPYYLYRQKNMSDNLENIGYARYGKEGLYNILIMEEKQTILALGAGAMSKFVFQEENRIERVDSVKSITDYIERIDEMLSRKRDFIQNNPGM